MTRRFLLGDTPLTRKLREYRGIAVLKSWEAVKRRNTLPRTTNTGGIAPWISRRKEQTERRISLRWLSSLRANLNIILSLFSILVLILTSFSSLALVSGGWLLFSTIESFVTFSFQNNKMLALLICVLITGCLCGVCLALSDSLFPPLSG